MQAKMPALQRSIAKATCNDGTDDDATTLFLSDLYFPFLSFQASNLLYDHKITGLHCIGDSLCTGTVDLLQTDDT